MLIKKKKINWSTLQQKWSQDGLIGQTASRKFAQRHETPSRQEGELSYWTIASESVVNDDDDADVEPIPVMTI